MICPLRGPDGRPRTVHSIEFGDLPQLENFDEGYVVEYKANFEKDVRDKIPKVVASFSNTEGGWIFIGINDKVPHTVTSIDRPSRGDIGQIVGELVSTRVSPAPRIDAQFICDPEDSTRGVAVIEVMEGGEPPYIADGSVYVRVSSSSHKFGYMQPAESSVLVSLWRKRERFSLEASRFARRTAFFPVTETASGTQRCLIPIFDVYLMRKYAEHGDVTTDDLATAAQVMEEAFIACGVEKCRCQHTDGSLLFRSRSVVPVDDAAPVIELLYDGSMKLSVPCHLYQGDEREEAFDRIGLVHPIRSRANARIIEGMSTIANLSTYTKIMDRYLELRNRSLDDFIYSCEFENLQGSLVDFRARGFEGYLRDRGVPFVGALDHRSSPRDLRHSDHDHPLSVEHLAAIDFLESCGLPFAPGDEDIFLRLRRIIEGWGEEE